MCQLTTAKSDVDFTTAWTAGSRPEHRQNMAGQLMTSPGLTAHAWMGHMRRMVSFALADPGCACWPAAEAQLPMLLKDSRRRSSPLLRLPTPAVQA